MVFRSGRHPKTITARFREGTLIKLWYYCRFSYSTLKCYITHKAAGFTIVDDKRTIAAFTVAIQLDRSFRFIF